MDHADRQNTRAEMGLPPKSLFHEAAIRAPERLKTWTDEMVAALRTLRAEGLSASQIANRLGDVSRNAVIGKLTRLKIPMTEDTMLVRERARVARRKVTKDLNRVRIAREREMHALKRMLHIPPIMPTHDLPVVDGGPPSKRIAVADLEPQHCRWIAGDPRVDATACGHDRVPGLAYCDYHRIRSAARLVTATVRGPDKISRYRLLAGAIP